MESTQEEDRDSMISTFCSITGVETERGQFYLESADWNLQVSLCQNTSTNTLNTQRFNFFCYTIHECVIDATLPQALTAIVL